MNSRPHDELISAYADGETTPEESAVVEKLLEQSPEARRLLADVRGVSGLLRNLPAQSAPDELAGAVLKRAERATLLGPAEPDPAARPSRRSTALISAVSITATVALAVTITLKMNQPVPPTTESVASDAPRSSLGDRLAFEQSADDEDASAIADGASDLVTNSRSVEMPLPTVASKAGFGGFANDNLDVLESAPASVGPDAEKYFYSGLNDAEVGDVVDAWRMGTKDVVVVQLTVVDRQVGLDSLQLLLTDSGVPLEAPAGNNRADQNGNGYHAVYLESDPSVTKQILSKLQIDEQVTDIQVAGLMPTENINADFAKNGYSAVPVPDRSSGELLALRRANQAFLAGQLMAQTGKPLAQPNRETDSERGSKEAGPPAQKSDAPAPARAKGGELGSNVQPEQRRPEPDSASAVQEEALSRNFAFRNRQRQLVVPSDLGEFDADGLLGRHQLLRELELIERPSPPPLPIPADDVAELRDQSAGAVVDLNKDSEKKSRYAAPADESVAKTAPAETEQFSRGLQVLFVVVPKANPAPAAPAERPDDCLDQTG